MDKDVANSFPWDLTVQEISGEYKYLSFVGLGVSGSNLNEEEFL